MIVEDFKYADITQLKSNQFLPDKLEVQVFLSVLILFYRLISQDTDKIKLVTMVQIHLEHFL